MKKCISLFIVLALLLSLLPAALAAEEQIILSGDGDWLTTSVTVDNTRDYTISCDVHMPNIESCTTPDTWADSLRMVIRNTTADHYLNLQLQSYCNGSGGYQLAPSAQVWQKSGWSDRDFLWSNATEAPISNLHMELSYAAAGGSYSWVLSHGDTGAVINTHSLTAGYVTSELKNCSSCELKFHRNPTDVTVSNVKLTYTESGGTATVVSPADLGWESDSADFTGWTADSGGNMTVTYDVATNSRIWQELLSDKNNFTIDLDVRNDKTSSTYVKIFGVTLELDSNNGSGNQTYIKLGGKGYDWLSGSNCRFHVNISRENGGVLMFTVTGENNAVPFSNSVAAADTNAALELGLYRGVTTFANISTDGSGGDSEEPEVSYTSQVWELGSGWAVNSEDTELLLSANVAQGSKWKGTIDATQPFGWSTVWTMDSEIPTVNRWSGKLVLRVEDPASGDYLYIRLQRYLQSSGKYQVLLQVQYWDNAAASWSNYIADSWGTCSHTNPLHKVGIVILREEDSDILKVQVKDGNQILCQSFIKPAYFEDKSLADKFTSRMMENTALNLYAETDSNNECLYSLSKPSTQLPAKVVTQIEFTGDDIWQAGTDENGLCFTLLEPVSSKISYNAELNAAEGFDFSYDINALSYGTVEGRSAVGNVFWLRYSQERCVFARVFLTERGTYRIVAQHYDPSGESDWSDVLSCDYTAGIADGTLRLRLKAENGVFTVSALTSGGEILATYSGNNLPDDFFQSESITFQTGTENDRGLFKLSNFKGMPEIFSSDYSSQPFGKLILSGDIVNETWGDLLAEEMEEFQNLTPEVLYTDAIEAAPGSLVVLAEGIHALLSGEDVDTFGQGLEDKALAAKNSGAVVVLTGLPYLSDTALGSIGYEAVAAYEARIRAIAEANGLIYANLYAPMGETPWSVKADGKTLSEIGNVLVEGAVFEELLYHCSCFAVNSTGTMDMTMHAPVEPTEAALEAFRSATTETALREAILNNALGLDIKHFIDLTNANRSLVLQSLLKIDRSSITSHEEADALFTLTCMTVSRANPKEEKTGAPFLTYVAVGASQTVSEGAMNKSRDSYPARFKLSVSSLQGETATLINKAISGTAISVPSASNAYASGLDEVYNFVVRYHPDILTVDYGGNDYSLGVDYETFIAAYRSYLEIITEQCPNTLIILRGQQCRLNADGRNEGIMVWNEGIKALAEEFGCIYSDSMYDFYRHGTGAGWLYSDTVHLSNAGYRIVANGLLQDLNAYVNLAPEEEPTQVEVKISHTVSFDSDLQMNYRIKLADILAAVPNYVTEGAYLTVEKDRYPMGGGAMTVETVTLYPDLTTDAERMLFNLAGIQSVEMGSELRAVLHFFDENGNEYCTTVDTYSVLAYAELCFDYYDPATDGYLFTMLIDCLNYGAAAQVAFDRRADEPVNAGLEAYQQYASTELSAELTDVRTYVDNDRTITAVTAMGFTVTFADKTEINAKLTIAEGYTKADITSVKVLNESGEEVAVLTEFTELDDGRLQVTFTGMKSVDMRNMYYFVAYVGDQVASQNVGYSIEAYAKSNIASGDAGDAALARACIYYGDSAKIYFDSLTK